MVYRVPMQPELGFKWSAGDRRISFQFEAIENCAATKSLVARNALGHIHSKPGEREDYTICPTFAGVQCTDLACWTTHRCVCLHSDW